MALIRDLAETHDIGSQTRESLVSAQGCPALRNYGMSLCGISEAKPGFHFVRQDPKLCQILVTVSGSGRVLLGREWMSLQPGQAYLQPAHQLHAYQATEPEWCVVWAMWNDVSGVPGPLRIAETQDAAAIHAAVRGLHAEIHAAAELLITSAYVSLINTFLRRIAGPTEELTLGRLWASVSGDPGYPWTLALLAEAAQLHPEALRRRCLKEFGTTPMRRVSELRLHHAAALLTSTGLSVAAIAERVGYSDPFAFTTAFSRCFGHPPSQHRKQTQDS